MTLLGDWFELVKVLRSKHIGEEVLKRKLEDPKDAYNDHLVLSIKSEWVVVRQSKGCDFTKEYNEECHNVFLIELTRNFRLSSTSVKSIDTYRKEEYNNHLDTETEPNCYSVKNPRLIDHVSANQHEECSDKGDSTKYNQTTSHEQDDPMPEPIFLCREDTGH